MQSSSVNSTCVEVSPPFKNNLVVDGSNRSTPQSSELGDDNLLSDDNNEVDLAQQNMLQILHAESPQQSIMSSDACDLHWPQTPNILVTVDGEAASVVGDEEIISGSGESSRVDNLCSSPQDEAKGRECGALDAKDNEKQSCVRLDSKPSDTGNHTHCAVHKVSFGGLHTFFSTSSPPTDCNQESSMQLDGEDKSLTDYTEESELEKESQQQGQSNKTATTSLGGHDDFKPFNPALVPPSGIKGTGTPYEVHTACFRGLHTSSTIPSPEGCVYRESTVDGKDSVQSENDNEDSTGQQATKSSNLDPVLDPQPNNKITGTTCEVHAVKFRGLSTFHPSLRKERKCASMLAVHKDEGVSTQHEVYTVTFGGLYTFTTTLSPTLCD